MDAIQIASSLAQEENDRILKRSGWEPKCYCGMSFRDHTLASIEVRVRSQIDEIIDSYFESVHLVSIILKSRCPSYTSHL